MDDRAGLVLEDDLRLHVAALRYFKPAPPFATAFAAATGVALPSRLTAARVSLPGAAAAGPLIFAWMRPTQTLALAQGAAALEELGARLAQAAGGQVVTLTGGLRILRLRGARVAELIGRLGSAGAPRLNEAKRVRLADVPVLTLSVCEGEVLLAVERAYARHLLEWLEVTLGDW
ncbi:MAG TPA: hypothetical protein VKQ31_06845 [Steroidobacteraceae bacterium]|nr:hypothetical protein [Steroidobacteraceae bacterium]